jgi:putative mRNA 3-end processing factor
MTKSFTLRFLGGVDQIGRSAILVSSNGSNILLDYGVELKRPPLFPLPVAPRELDGLVLSHAHLDHTGSSPYLYISGAMNTFTTPPTIDQTDILVKDFLKLSGPMLPYEYLDLKTMEGKSIPLNYKEQVEVKNTPFTLQLLNAGHIPGSSQVLLETGSKRLLYTSDINSVESRLQPPADTDYGELDVLICESTYAGIYHPDRRENEKAFVEKVTEVVEGGGVAFIPTFAIARSQEIAMILVKNGFEENIYMDGMALTATKIFLNHSSFLKDPRGLEYAMERVTEVDNWKQRKRVVEKPCAIIAPAGMLGGGSAVYYMSRVYKDERNAIFIVGFQIPGTPGRALKEEGKAYIKGKKEKVLAEVHEYLFSSHIDQRGFEELFRSLKGQPKVFLVHGEKSNIKALHRFVEDEIGLEVIDPRLGETYDLDSSGPL